VDQKQFTVDHVTDIPGGEPAIRIRTAAAVWPVARKHGRTADPDLTRFSRLGAIANSDLDARQRTTHMAVSKRVTTKSRRHAWRCLGQSIALLNSQTGTRRELFTKIN